MGSGFLSRLIPGACLAHLGAGVRPLRQTAFELTNHPGSVIAWGRRRQTMVSCSRASLETAGPSSSMTSDDAEAGLRPLGERPAPRAGARKAPGGCRKFQMPAGADRGHLQKVPDEAGTAPCRTWLERNPHPAVFFFRNCPRRLVRAGHRLTPRYSGIAMRKELPRSRCFASEGTSSKAHLGDAA